MNFIKILKTIYLYISDTGSVPIRSVKFDENVRSGYQPLKNLLEQKESISNFKKNYSIYLKIKKYSKLSYKIFGHYNVESNITTNHY